MAYTPFYNEWIDADYDANGNLTSASSTPFTAAAAEHWDAALADAVPQTAKGDLVGFDGTDTAVVPVGTDGAALVADSAQAAGVRWSVNTYVPATQRAPLGGLVTITYAATITPNAATSTAGVVIATGNLTVNAPTGGVTGEMYMLEVAAASANRTVTLDAGIELTTSTTRAYTITSGQRGFFGLRMCGDGSWTLMSQTQQITG